MNQMEGPPLNKFLASTGAYSHWARSGVENHSDWLEDKKTRDEAIKNLSIFLSNPTNTGDAFSKREIAKLWKGIFYCTSFSLIYLVILQFLVAGRFLDVR